jgi:hypothetical protein
VAPGNEMALLGILMVSYPLVNQLARLGREYLQGGSSGLITWWRSAWPMILTVELLPLPLALLGAAIMNRLGVGYFLLSGLSLIAAAAAVRRAALNLQTQGRSVRELALLNEVSRAIIRSELNIEALCDLIHRRFIWGCLKKVAIFCGCGCKIACACQCSVPQIGARAALLAGCVARGGPYW